jgi:hypothetical protein
MANLKDPADVRVQGGMRIQILAAIVCVQSLTFWNCTALAEELIQEQISRSPDGRKQIETRIWIEPTWNAPRIDVVLKEGEKVLFRRIIPPDREARYVKVSWAPASNAALVAVNFKSSEDWILIRLAKGNASSDYFNGSELVMSRMLDELPFRDEIKSIAPVGRVPWKEIQWRDPKQCAMPFIYRGIGYEGTANLLIDFKKEKPTFTVTSIVATVDSNLWKQD